MHARFSVNLQARTRVAYSITKGTNMHRILSRLYNSYAIGISEIGIIITNHKAHSNIVNTEKQYMCIVEIEPSWSYFFLFQFFTDLVSILGKSYRKV